MASCDKQICDKFHSAVSEELRTRTGDEWTDKWTKGLHYHYIPPTLQGCNNISTLYLTIKESKKKNWKKMEESSSQGFGFNLLANHTSDLCFIY